MISMFRAFTQTWFAKAFLVILGLGMVVTLGFGGRFHMPASNAVVQAGSHVISQGVFKRIFSSNLEDLEKQNNQQVTFQDAVNHGFDQEILQGLIGDESSAELASRLGVSAAPKLLVDALRQQQAFFDPVTGKFDEKQYEQELAKINLTPAEFEGQLKDEIAQNQLMTGLAAGLKAPKIYAALVADYTMESRSVSYLVIQPSKALEPPPPTDAQLTAFMNQNKAVLQRPEMRVLSIVRFSPKALAPTMPVDQGAVQKLYAFKKDAQSTPEKRSLVEIPAKDPASAAAAAKRLQAGEAPDAVAKSLGVAPIAYDNVIKSGVADPKVADAAFAMTVGAVSAPIKSDLGGYPVIKLTAITPATTPTLESMRPQLEAQARQDAAAKQAFAEVQKFDTAHQGGANLAASAKQAGVSVITVGPVTASGVDVTNQPVAGVSPKLLKQAFAQPLGGETDSEKDDGQGEYFAVRVEKIIPPGVPPLAEIRDKLAQAFIAQAVVAKMQAQADALSARIKKGESFEAVAASAKLQVGHANGVNQQGAQQGQYRALGDGLVGQLLQAKPGDVVTGQTAGGAIMVAKIDSIAPVPPGAAASAMIGFSPRLSQQLAQDMAQAERDWAKKKIKPKSDIKQARQAIGVTDPAAALGKGSGIAP
jgi:peptidyl-prolyl cis-trans isomerase D